MQQSQPDPEWQAASRSEVEGLIRAEEAHFDDERRAMWERFRIPLTQASIRRSTEWGIEAVFVVAKNGSRVLYFDDVEDEFAFGDVSPDNMISFIGFVGELRYAIAAIGDREDLRPGYFGAATKLDGGDEP